MHIFLVLKCFRHEYISVLHVFLTCINFWHSCISDMHIFLTSINYTWWHIIKHIFLKCVYFWKYMNIQTIQKEVFDINFAQWSNHNNVWCVWRTNKYFPALARRKHLPLIKFYKNFLWLLHTSTDLLKQADKSIK